MLRDLLPPHRSVAAALLVGVCGFACAHSANTSAEQPVALDLTPAASVAASVEAPAITARAGELSPAPEVCPSPRCGVAGTASEVSLDAPRDEALRVFERYVRAVSARSTDGVRALLDDAVLDARDGSASSRETVVTLHARLFEVMDARGFEATEVRALSYAESRRMNRGVQMDPGDWLVEWNTQSFRATSFPAVAAVPRLIVVRWRGGVARVAAFNHEFLNRRARGL